LNELHAALQGQTLNYWRDKTGHEVDFVWNRQGQKPFAIECKWSASDFDPHNLEIFRKHHPGGDNVVVAHDVQQPFVRTFGDIPVKFESLAGLIEQATHSALSP
jgi:predicted AAA+ superfamily ATPase